MGSRSDSVAIYSLETGDKIKISGDNFQIPGPINWQGISETGNALGRFRGIYGTEEPTLVVDYGTFNTVDTNEEVSLMAFFDLRTGKLISTKSFR